MRLLLNVLVLSAVLSVAACSGRQVRDRAGEPALGGDIARRILDEARAGGDSGAVERFEAAVESGNWDAARAEWPAVEASARAGVARAVESGEIDPEIAESLIERIERFEDVLGRMR